MIFFSETRVKWKESIKSFHSTPEWSVLHRAQSLLKWALQMFTVVYWRKDFHLFLWDVAAKINRRYHTFQTCWITHLITLSVLNVMYHVREAQDKSSLPRNDYTPAYPWKGKKIKAILQWLILSCIFCLAWMSTEADGQREMAKVEKNKPRLTSLYRNPNCNESNSAVIHIQTLGFPMHRLAC
jgi:hypothetical protein